MKTWCNMTIFCLFILVKIKTTSELSETKNKNEENCYRGRGINCPTVKSVRGEKTNGEKGLLIYDYRPFGYHLLLCCFYKAEFSKGV